MFRLSQALRPCSTPRLGVCQTSLTSMFDRGYATQEDQSGPEQDTRTRSITQELFGENLYQTINKHVPHMPRRSHHPYRNMFPWNSIDDFTEHLVSSVCYNDGRLVCLVKPWGVGHHEVMDQNQSRKNLDSSVYRILGMPKFCLDDAINHLRTELQMPTLKQFKSLDRYKSGIVMYAADEETPLLVNKAFERARAAKEPIYRHFAVTKGIPALRTSFVSERVAMELKEIGTTTIMEPVITSLKNVSQNNIKHHKVFPFTVEMRLLQTNKKDAAALVEVATTGDKYDFLRAYLANKASFILGLSLNGFDHDFQLTSSFAGDSRFSNRVRTVLGAPVRISPILAHNARDFEPLTENLKSKLKVSSNAQIPLHLHLNEIKLVGGYETKRRSKSKSDDSDNEKGKTRKKKEDIIISCNALPPHLEWTLQQLQLCPSSDAYQQDTHEDDLMPKNNSKRETSYQL